MPLELGSASAEKEKRKGSLRMSGHRMTPQSGSASAAQQTAFASTATPTATATAATAPAPIPIPTQQTPTQTQTAATTTQTTATPTQTQTAATTTPTTATPTPATPVQAQARADSALPTPPSGIHDKELLTKSKLMQREAFQGGAASMPEARTLINAVDQYEQTINNFTIPVSSGESFIRDMGRVNAGVTSAHEQLMNIMVQTSMTMRKASQSKLPKSLARLNPKFARAAKLADDCALLANIMQSQKIYINKIYDDMVNAARTNPASLRQFFGKSYAEVIRNMDMYHFSSGRRGVRQLGAGATNTVYMDSYQGRDMVFKRGKVHEYKYSGRGERAETAFEVLRDRMGYQEEEMPSYMAEREEALTPGYDAETRESLRQKVIRDVNSANRDVAYSRLNALFGFDVAVSTQLAKSEEGDTSSLMTLASGQTAGEFQAYAGPEQKAIIEMLALKKYESVVSKIERELAQIQSSLATEKNPQMLARLREDLPAKQAELEKVKKKGPARTLDLADPRLTMQFFKMSVLDIVAGQVDRHTGNYMINPDAEGGPKLTAIDNDTAFGTTTDIETTEQINARNQVTPALEETFRFVPPEIKNRVMEVTQTDLAQTLAGLLSKPQIDAACTRLEKLQKYMTELEKHSKVKDITAENSMEAFGRNTIGNYQSALLSQSIQAATSIKWFTDKIKESDPQYVRAQEASRRFMFDEHAYEMEKVRKQREKALAARAARQAASPIPSPPATQRQ